MKESYRGVSTLISQHFLGGVEDNHNKPAVGHLTGEVLDVSIVRTSKCLCRGSVSLDKFSK
jgi:hypothetical protein